MNNEKFGFFKMPTDKFGFGTMEGIQGKYFI